MVVAAREIAWELGGGGCGAVLLFPSEPLGVVAAGAMSILPVTTKEAIAAGALATLLAAAATADRAGVAGGEAYQRRCGGHATLPPRAMKASRLDRVTRTA